MRELPASHPWLRRLMTLTSSRMWHLMLLWPLGVGAQGARVQGTVIDSTRMRPVVGARVYAIPVASGGRIQGTTDSLGRYVFESLPFGAYLLDVRHERRDSLGAEVPVVSVTLREAATVTADLGLPSSGTIVARACGREVADEGGGVLFGEIRSAGGGELAPGGTVTARWQTFVPARRRVQRDSGRADAAIGADGRYRFCGVPPGAGMRLVARAGADSSGIIDVVMSPERVVRRDVTVGVIRVARQVARDATGDTLTVMALTGPARLHGVIRDIGGRPVAGVRVQLAGGGVIATTSGLGVFVLDSLPAGSHTLRARALGFAPYQQVVDLAADGETRVEIAMGRATDRLTPIRVVASRSYGSEGYARFEQRRLEGKGWFMGAEEIERQVAVYPTDLLLTAPGVYLTTLGPTATIELRTIDGARCHAIIMVDGALFRGDAFDLQSLASVERLVGIEVYTRGRPLPNELLGALHPKCGVVAFWTGERRRDP